MSTQLLSSKIVVQEEPPSLRTIQNIESGVLAALGITKMGPVGVPTLLTSFEEFVRIFGGDIAAGIATSAVRGFFVGGGQRMYFTRVVHYTDITDATTKTSAAGTLNLMTAATGPTPAVLVSASVGPYNISGGNLLLSVNGTSDSADFSNSGETPDFADLSAATIAELKTVIERDVAGVIVDSFGGKLRITTTATGDTATLQANSFPADLDVNTTVHTGDDGDPRPTLKIDAKYDGAYASDVSVLIVPASSNLSFEFNLHVMRNGVVVERFENLRIRADAERHPELIINAPISGSNYVTVTALLPPPATNSQALLQRPANSPGNPATPFGPLSGGSDGLVGIDDVDFVGDAASRLGLRAFDICQDIDLLICPDRTTPAVHLAALSYVSVTRNNEVFFIADPPAGLSAEGIVTYVNGGLKNSVESAAIYWPRVKVLNPNATIYGGSDTIIIPPSGHIAGMIARTDSRRVGGIYDAPGGVERGQLPGVVGFETDTVLDEAVRDFVTPHLINPITRLRGQPLAVDDVQTLKSGGAFPTISERRGVSSIERAIKDGLQFARLRNNDEALRDEVERTIEAFLLIQMRVGAFRSKDPSKAFFVDVGEAINPPSQQFVGKLTARVGLATQKPARFIILSFAQDTRAIDEELAAVSG